ncbi:MAG TPA: hypothetical protein VIT45_06080 [Allosphingosinicella sp.]
MSHGLMSALHAFVILLTALSGIYLLINARSVIALFSKPSNELAPGPSSRRVPRGRLYFALAAFLAGFLLSFGFWSVSGTDAVSNAVEGDPEEVQRP